MEIDIFEATSALAATLAALAAIFSGICAFLSYKLSRALWDELKSDERLLASEPIHPKLQYHDHSLCVLNFTLFNKSKRKVFIKAIHVNDSQGEEIEVDWSHQIDNLGNPIAPSQLVGVVDSSPVYIRRRDGRSLNVARIDIYHSFPDSPTIVEADECKSFGPREKIVEGIKS